MALPEPLRASAQHIGLLNNRRRLLDNKRRRLVDALVSAELQFLAALRREGEAGETSWAQLRDAYATLSAGPPGAGGDQVARHRYCRPLVVRARSAAAPM